MKLRELGAKLRGRRIVQVAVAHLIAACMLVVMGMLAGGAGRYVDRRETAVRTVELDPRVVMVLPFDVGSADASLAYLREGMVDLLALKLTGVRAAVPARTALAAWQSGAGMDADSSRAAVLRVGTQLRAGTVLHGSVAGSGDRITLSAALVDVASGEELATAVESGGVEELASLVDRLVATVSGADGGVVDERLDALTSTSFPALRTFLSGNALYRGGRYQQAVESYGLALELDSTFALAALRLLDAAELAPDVAGEWATRGEQLVRAHRDRLPARERAYVDARWPIERAPSIAVSLERLERVVQQFPDWPEAWYHFGHAVYRSGGLVGDGERLDRARAGFARALALDSTHVAAIRQLMKVADRTADTMLLFHFSDRYLAAELASGDDFAYRLAAAQWRGDTIAVRHMLAELDTFDVRTLTGTIIDQQLTPRPLSRLDFARRATELLAERAHGAAERHNALLYRYQIEMNAGRPHDARAFMDSVPSPDPLAWDRRRIYDAVYWDGDSATAAVAAQRVQRHLRRVPRGPLSERNALALCALTTRRLARGQTNGASAAIERLRVPHPASPAASGRQICALSLAAVLAQVEEAPDAEARLLELDSILRTGPLAAGFREHGNITAARLFEARGDVPRALAASRRRLLDAGGQSYLSTFLELECRLADAAGEHDAARRACARYVALRADPEPHLVEQASAAAIRAEARRDAER